MISIDTESEYY
jgi:hypothetical protein